MAEEIVNDDASSGGEHDESKEAFLSKWDAMTDSERAARAATMYAESRGLNRKTTALSDELRELKSVGAESETEAETTLEGLRDEIATVRAERKVVDTQAALISKALAADIDPRMAVEFAGSADPDGAFDRAVAEIERKTTLKVNERLTGGKPPRPSARIERLSQRERARVPPSVASKLFGDYVDELGRDVGKR